MIEAAMRDAVANQADRIALLKGRGFSRPDNRCGERQQQRDQCAAAPMNQLFQHNSWVNKWERDNGKTLSDAFHFVHPGKC